MVEASPDGRAVKVRIVIVGSANTDLLVTVPRLPRPGETLLGTSFRDGFGGKGANQAVMAARLGAQVTVVMRVGNDTFGRATIGHFREEGIDVSHVVVDEELPSGVAPILVDEATGQNMIVVAPGANSRLSPNDVAAARPSLVAAQVVVAQLETPMAATEAAFRIAREAGAITVLNPAPASPVPGPLLELTDVLVPNEVEAAELTGLPVTSVEEGFSAAAKLRESGVGGVVMTLGARGALAVTTDGRFHVPAPSVAARDTSGAGDAFVGTLAYAIASGLPLPASVELACRVATETVKLPGTQSSYPSAQELRSLTRPAAGRQDRDRPR